MWSKGDKLQGNLWPSAMAGTKSGARKSIKTKKEKFGEEYFREIGRMGGRKRSDGPNKQSPFNNRKFASEMGRLGGQLSKQDWGVKKAESTE